MHCQFEAIVVACKNLANFAFGHADPGRYARAMFPPCVIHNVCSVYMYVMSHVVHAYTPVTISHSHFLKFAFSECIQVM